MAIISRVQACGISPMAATNIVGDNANGLTATGSAITDALQLTAAVSHFGTVGASTGAKAPQDMNPGDSITVYNGGASTLSLYPTTALGVINGGSAGAAFSVAANKMAVLTRFSSTAFGAFVTA